MQYGLLHKKSFVCFSLFWPQKVNVKAWIDNLLQSCAKELEWSLFQDSEETIHSAEMKAIEKKQKITFFKKPKTEDKKRPKPESANSQRNQK